MTTMAVSQLSDGNPRMAPTSYKCRARQERGSKPQNTPAAKTQTSLRRVGDWTSHPSRGRSIKIAHTKSGIYHSHRGVLGRQHDQTHHDMSHAPRRNTDHLSQREYSRTSFLDSRSLSRILELELGTLSLSGVGWLA